MVHFCNPSTQEAEVGGAAFWVSLSYIDPVSRKKPSDLTLI
jgi:hypothetical protein